MKQAKQPKQKQTKQQDLSSLIINFQEYQRRRSYQENDISRLKRTVLDKYERVATTKRRMQYFESWHASTDVSSTYPMELTDCYKLSASPSSSFESLKIVRLKEDHIIHQFVRKLRESDLVCTVIHNFQSFPNKFKCIESLIIKCYVESLYPSHSQLFDFVIQPLFIELIESFKKPDEFDHDSKKIVEYLYQMLHVNYFQSYFGQNISTKLDSIQREESKFVLKLIHSLIHHRITNIMFAPLQKIIIKIARGDLIFNFNNENNNLYNLCVLCIDCIYECDYSALLDIFATLFDCLHFSVLELSHSQCIHIINYIIWQWIILPIIYEPFRFGFRISYITQWQQTSCCVFIGVLKDILTTAPQTKTHKKTEYDLSEKELSLLQQKMNDYITIFEDKLQQFVSFQAQSQSQSSAAENVSNYNEIHEYNFGILHNWTMISSIELYVLHSILFSDSSSLSSSQIRSLERFHKLTFESLDQTATTTETKTKTQREESTISTDSDCGDSFDILAKQLTDKILNSNFKNSYMFIVGVYPYNDIYLQWQFKCAATAIDTNSLQHLSKICKKNIHYLSSLQIHIKKAPHIFAAWCHSLIKLLLNLNHPLPRNTMIYLAQKENENETGDELMAFESAMSYLHGRDIKNPSLLYGVSNKNSSKSADFASIYFGLKQLHEIYPTQIIHFESIIQWLSLCLTEATKICNAWHQSSIQSLHKVLIQLSSVDSIYRQRIQHIKHCLYSTKIHYFAAYTKVSFHKAIPIPNILFNDDGVIEEKSKYIFYFFCDSVASFLDKILFSLHDLSKLPKVIPILLQKFINVISNEMKDHSAHCKLDHGMLRGLHHIICIAMYYILNQQFWIFDQKLNQSLEILTDEKTMAPLDPFADLGLNKNIKISSDLWQWIGKELHSLEYHITPSTKMQCIHEIIQSLSHHLYAQLKWIKSIQNNNDNNITVGADDLFPSLIWLIIQSQPKRLSSSLSLIEYISESPTSGIHAYSFTLFKQSISYIQQLANDKANQKRKQ